MTLYALPILASAGSVLLAILGIAFLIFVHELGHYLACRLTGTRVETFSIGFGPRLLGWENVPGQPRRFTWGRRRLDPADHAMDFRVAVVPLGGYVKMAGEIPGQGRSGSPDEFPSKSLSARAFVISAGVIMNAIAAVLLYFVAFAAGAPVTPAVAGGVSPGGPAWAAGVQPGDRFLRLGDRPVRSFRDLKVAAVFLSRDRASPAQVERDGGEVELRVVPRYDEEAGAVQIGVLLSAEFRLRQGEASVVVGPAEAATVAGVPVRGGREAAEVFEVALRSGLAEIPVATARASAAFRPVAAPAGGTPVYRVGVEPYGRVAVKAARGAAKAAGLGEGDVLAAVFAGGTRIPIDSPADAPSLLFRGPIEALEVQRGVETVTLALALADAAAIHRFLADVHLSSEPGTRAKPVQAGTVVPGPSGERLRYPSSPSEEAGLEPGDAIVRFAGADVETWDDLLARVRTIADVSPVEAVVRGEDGAERTLSIRPVALERLAEPALEIEVPLVPLDAGGVGNAFVMAAGRTWGEITDAFRLIGALVTGKVNFQKNIGGPGTIVQVSSSAAEQSVLTFLTFLAYISVMLAVLNILPIPVLDGGHLVFLLLEKIKGSPLEEKTLGRIQLVGFALLLLLMFFAISNDVRNLWPK